MKEIGSIYPLDGITSRSDGAVATNLPEDRIYYSLCREALHEIAVSNDKGNKTVLIPAYTCQTVITPFGEAGWNTQFYSITKKLRIDVENLLDACNRCKPALLVVHPYFGMDLDKDEDDALSYLKSKGVKIIVDLTQCIFSTKQYKYSDYIVGSYRKWFPIPDGAFLKTEEKIEHPLIENNEFTDLNSWAMYLRWQYFKNGDKTLKEISIKLSKKADHIAENNILSHNISKLSSNLLAVEDQVMNQKQRYANYSFLFNEIKERNGICKVCNNVGNVSSAPLYFVIYVTSRKKLQTQLANNSIYAPVIWPVEDDRVLIDENVRYIYNNILAIPCDQRYNEQDMSKVAEIINNFGNE